jgi:hypothetical protein
MVALLSLLLFLLSEDVPVRDLPAMSLMRSFSSRATEPEAAPAALAAVAATPRPTVK